MKDTFACRGCYNNFYNFGVTKCWQLQSARLVLRRRVHMNEVPPWKAPPEKLPSCYRQSGYVFVGPKVER